MVKPDPDAWKEAMTVRERVRAVVDVLSAPASVEEVRHRADVSWDTAKRELERLEAENMVQVVTVDGDEQYRVNPVRLLFDEIHALIDDHDREELEAEIAAMREEEESLQEEFEASSADALRQRLAHEALSAEATREIRNMVSTWQAVEADIRLYRHALQLYDDVTRLQGGSEGVEVAS